MMDIKQTLAPAIDVRVALVSHLARTPVDFHVVYTLALIAFAKVGYVPRALLITAVVRASVLNRF